MDESYREEDSAHHVQAPYLTGVNGPLDTDHHQEGYGHVAHGVHQDGGQGYEGVLLVGPDVGHQPHDDLVVVRCAYHGLVGQVVLGGHAHAAGAHAPHAAHHSADAASRS